MCVCVCVLLMKSLHETIIDILLFHLFVGLENVAFKSVGLTVSRNEAKYFEILWIMRDVEDSAKTKKETCNNLFCIMRRQHLWCVSNFAEQYFIILL